MPGAAPSDLSQRAVLISGCSSGIGLTVAHGLKSRGYRVFPSARRAEDVAMLEQEGFAEALQLDVREPESIAMAVDTLLQRTDGIVYGLFNNAGYGQPGAVEDLSRAVLREQFETNVFGAHDLSCRLLPAMRAQGYGRIIQHNSVLGLVSLKFRGAYNASKYALEGLTDTLRLELAGTDIHISSINTGPVTSRFRENAFAAYKRNIVPEGSPHRDTYRAMEKRLETKGSVVPFTLGPEAVLAKVILALESRRPRGRYYVTFPTYLLGGLKRLLSTRQLDRVLLKFSD